MTGKVATASPDLPRTLGLLFLCVYPFAVMLQGIDFTDMGFNLANQRLLLAHPESYVHGYLFYLSNLLGGLWLQLSEPLGLLGARLGWVLVIGLTLLSAFAALRGLMSDRMLVLGLCVSLVWANQFGVVWIDYNHVAALFATLAALALCRAPRPAGSVVAGALVACAAMARLPSIALAVLGVALLLPSQPSEAWSSRVLRCAAFVTGLALGLLLLIGLMSMLGHLDGYSAALQQRFMAGQDNPDYDYSAGSILGSLIADYARAALSAAVALSLFAVFALLARGTSAARVLLMVILALAVGLVVRIDAVVVTAAGLAGVLRLGVPGLMVHAAGEGYVRLLDVAVVALATALIVSLLPGHWPWLLPALMIAALSWVSLSTDSIALRRAAVVALALLVATPLGSGNGIRNAVFGLWLALPLLMWFMWNGYAQLMPGIGGAARNVALALFCALLVLGLGNVWSTPYRDVPDRRLLVHAPRAPFISSGRTNEARAAVVSDLVRALDGRVKPGDALLIHGSCPLLHVITGTRPVLGVVWPAVYTLGVFERRLQGLADAAGLPPVLMSAGSCRAASWPYQSAMTTGEQAQRRRLAAFMAEHGYQQRWSNPFFSFWTVP